MARTNITDDMIRQMNELYLEIKSYAGVSRAMGGVPAATTVKKYIIPNYKKTDNSLQKCFKLSDLPEESHPRLMERNWVTLLLHTPEEVAEMKTLWKEMEL